MIEMEKEYERNPLFETVCDVPGCKRPYDKRMVCREVISNDGQTVVFCTHFLQCCERPSHEYQVTHRIRNHLLRVHPETVPDEAIDELLDGEGARMLSLAMSADPLPWVKLYARVQDRKRVKNGL